MKKVEDISVSIANFIRNGVSHLHNNRIKMRLVFDFDRGSFVFKLELKDNALNTSDIFVST